VIVTSRGPVSVDWLRRNVRYFKDMQIDLMLGIETGATETELVDRGVVLLQEAVPNVSAQDIQTHRSNIQRGYRELSQLLTQAP
ncbi:MAG: hypothetical protein R3194_06760, partial [Limnobacter sp.]|nr:hypothetical protein [Limnobacter sp.]